MIKGSNINTDSKGSNLFNNDASYNSGTGTINISANIGANAISQVSNTKSLQFAGAEGSYTITTKVGAHEVMLMPISLATDNHVFTTKSDLLLANTTNATNVGILTLKTLGSSFEPDSGTE
ncbi:MAG: hypothetical protein K0Q51_340 [Rickettsiaceae bacterium]|jgi:hypothetical protein|nr:hypothetical protein [Rickettsiaceae bacterium]